MIPINFFENVDDVKNAMAGKEPVVFLDYDGTLTPIVATPDLAIISDEMREAVRALSQRRKVSIVSGRATDDVRGKAEIDGIFYAGSHGFVGMNLRVLSLVPSQPASYSPGFTHT